MQSINVLLRSQKTKVIIRSNFKQLYPKTSKFLRKHGAKTGAELTN